jgi:predicted ATPase
MSLLSIRLRNFRSFLDTGTIELRPIVVLVGANNFSAGQTRSHLAPVNGSTRGR